MRLGFRAEAARHDHAAVLGERFADRVERLLARAIQEAAGVDDDDVRAGIVRGRLVTLGAQLAQDSLRIDERLRAAEADEADFRRMVLVAALGTFGLGCRARATLGANGGAIAPRTAAKGNGRAFTGPGRTTTIPTTSKRTQAPAEGAWRRRSRDRSSRT